MACLALPLPSMACLAWPWPAMAGHEPAMSGHGRPHIWLRVHACHCRPCMAGHGRPCNGHAWPTLAMAMVGHGRPWLHGLARPAVAGHGQLWPTKADHGWPWPAGKLQTARPLLSSIRRPSSILIAAHCWHASLHARVAKEPKTIRWQSWWSSSSSSSSS